MMKKLNIAIIGLGNIGSYLFKYLNKIKKFYPKKIIVYQILTYVSAKNKNKKRSILKFIKKQWLKNYLDATKKKMLI